jgi:hypothetical protein
MAAAVRPTVRDCLVHISGGVFFIVVVLCLGETPDGAYLHPSLSLFVCLCLAYLSQSRTDDRTAGESQCTSIDCSHRSDDCTRNGASCQWRSHAWSPSHTSVHKNNIVFKIESELGLIVCGQCGSVVATGAVMRLLRMALFELDGAHFPLVAEEFGDGDHPDVSDNERYPPDPVHRETECNWAGTSIRTAKYTLMNGTRWHVPRQVNTKCNRPSVTE